MTPRWRSRATTLAAYSAKRVRKSSSRKAWIRCTACQLEVLQDHMGRHGKTASPPLKARLAQEVGVSCTCTRGMSCLHAILTCPSASTTPTWEHDTPSHEVGGASVPPTGPRTDFTRLNRSPVRKRLGTTVLSRTLAGERKRRQKRGAVRCSEGEAKKTQQVSILLNINLYLLETLRKQ